MKDPSFISRYDLSVNAPTSGCTAIKTGGNCDFFATATDLTTLELLLKAARENNVPVQVLGNGSQSVISDHGYRGLLIKNEISYVDASEQTASVGSGTALTDCVHQLAKEGLGGLEALVGSPGTVGGALASPNPENTDLSGRVELVSVYTKGGLQEWNREAYQSAERGTYVILACMVRVETRGRTELQRHMLQATQTRLKNRPAGVPAIKVFADRDASDSLRQLNMAGERVGGAIVSGKDPNYIINDQGATSHDVYELAERMRNRAKVKLAKTLRVGISWVGEW